jgi:GxxExxY protein
VATNKKNCCIRGNQNTYIMTDIIYKEESYQIIGKCMEVHNQLGAGFLEIVYKDALEYEFRNANIPFEREKEYEVDYKGIILPHRFYADFVVFDKIILEVKGVSALTDEFTAQCINYLKVSGCKLALLVNFGELKLNYKRIVL